MATQLAKIVPGKSGPTSGDVELSPRQKRERDYHRRRAAELKAKIDEPVSLGVVKQQRRRWWNAYWETYRQALHVDLRGKRILVPGCGFGEDAIRLAAIGADVHAFDLSPESVAIARQRAAILNLKIAFAVMPAEQTVYPDRFFDAVWFLDILHHVDIAATVKETRRILKPGALIIGDELYTHSTLQRLRTSRFVVERLYPRMKRFIYGVASPYITADEHKIDEREFAIIERNFRLRSRLYFNFLIGRIVPDRFDLVAKLDRFLLKLLGPLGRFLAGRIVFIALAPERDTNPPLFRPSLFSAEQRLPIQNILTK
jgi:2-polyprenyl-3-methyl-5-hydroxy-6-metoxy-1,4-benzoquinol methylase